MAHHRHYVRDRGMHGLGWIGHVGLGDDDSEYYGSDDAGNDYYISDSTGGIVNEDGVAVSPSVPIYNDAGDLVSGSVAPIAIPAGAIGPSSAVPTPAQAGAAGGGADTYYGVDSKNNDIWVNSKGQYVNQDGLPITPSGSISVEGGGTYNPATGARSGSNTSGLVGGAGIAAGALPALLAPGPAPRVAVPVAAAPSFLTASSIIPGVSNLMIIGGGLLAVMLFAGKK
jgi:hypothetical protein